MTAKRTKQPPKKRGMKKPAAPQHAPAPPLTEDQKSWIEAFGSLDDYSTPEERQKFQEREHARHEQEAAASAGNDKPPKKAKVPEVIVPGVYMERGYMVLTMTKYDGEISFLDVSNESGKMRSLSIARFLDNYNYRGDLLPTALALNLIARAVQGSFESSVQVYRRLITMALNVEELKKMGDAAFAREYSRIMKLAQPVTRIRAKDRTPYINEMVKKLEEEAENLQASGGGEAAAAAEATPKDTAPAGGSAATSASNPAPAAKQPTKGIGMTKKAKKKVTGAAASKKAAATKSYPKIDKKGNPYRETSKKHKAFEEFKKGGERAALLAAIKKTGVTDSTASSWLNAFTKVKL